MSDLIEKIDKIMRGYCYTSIIDNMYSTDSHVDQILAAFKAHIEGCKPENPYNKTDSLSYGQFLHKGFLKGIEADRKALMEALEEEKR